MSALHRAVAALTAHHYRLLVLAALALCGAAIGWEAVSRDDGPTPVSTVTTSPATRGLPGGATSILPEHRVVAFYGAPQDETLGILGIGSPATAGIRLARQAKPYQRPQRPVMLAMELIAVVASAAPGEGGLHRMRQSDAVIQRYLDAAREANAILILDIQPGQADFLTEAKALEKYLREPDVSLALDPEWRMAKGQQPGKVIGSVDAREVNRVSMWLSQLVAANKLPDKLLILHQFTDGMIRDRRRLRARPGLDMVLNADGFGSPALKTATYTRVTRGRDHLFTGFKLFYEEDTSDGSPLMTPQEVLALRPAPLVVTYE